MTGNEYQKAALRTANTENQTQNSLLINGVWDCAVSPAK